MNTVLNREDVKELSETEINELLDQLYLDSEGYNEFLNSSRVPSLDDEEFIEEWTRERYESYEHEYV